MILFDCELNIRPGMVSSCLNVFRSVSTKCREYEDCVLSVLRYSSETWQTYTLLESSTFHMRCIETILCIRWQDNMTDEI